MNVPSLLVGVILACVVLATYDVVLDSDSAMKQCQKTHSYEVCFQILNR